MPNTTVVGSDLEVKVYNWLIRHGFKPGVDFDFQSQLIGLRGVRELGDAIADFVLIKQRIVFRIQGEYWHHTPEQNARDTVQKERLQGMGYTVIDLLESDLTDRFEYTMQQAVQGVQL
jgi:very-short-patch-repair endonuclease